uniref:Uncharacterized protein n=1 Tax=Anguilla anguilla TaxID=7936 RepID=A0A0E9UB28_ANGAN
MLWQDLKRAVQAQKPTNLSALSSAKKSGVQFLHSDVKD